MYNRGKAVQYAEKYWNSYNPQYRYFGADDCTNFISQVLHAGGISMVKTGLPHRGWWYTNNRGRQDQWSYSWTVANAFYQYLGQPKKTGIQAMRVQHPEQLQIGDVICYDWEGDGKWNHNTVVSLIDATGTPFVTAHSINSYNRYWGYQDSPAYTPQTRYAFFQILS